MEHSRSRGVLVAVALGAGAALLPAQPAEEEIFPGASKASLETRLALFERAQSEGRWDLVATLLGSYRVRMPFTATGKACLISQMQILPMISFDVKTYSYSTELRYVPPSRRWLYLDGDATFRMESGDRKEHVSVVAYRDAGEWYFTPNIDTLWEKTQLTAADFTRDRANEVRVANEPTCPVQISHVHAFLDKQIPSILNIRFRVTSRATKRIVGIETSPGGELIMEAALDPGSSHSKEVPESRDVLYGCDHVGKLTLAVQRVHFQDGTEWSRPNQTRESKPHLEHR